MKQELAERLVAGLREAGVNFISYLPESRMAEMMPLLEQDSSFQLTCVGHEGTAVSIACGAAYTGKQPAVYMEGTGLYLATFHLQTVAVRSMLPVLLLAAYVGSMPDRSNSFTFGGYGFNMARLLDTIGIMYDVVEDGHRLEQRVCDAVRAANSRKLPSCLLFTGEFS